MKENPFPAAGTAYEPSYRIAYLIVSFLRDDLSPAERDELDDWVGASKENLLLFEELTDEKEIPQTLQWFQDLEVERARKKVWQKIQAPYRPMHWRGWLPYIAAACLIVVAGIWYWQKDKPEASLSQLPPPLADIAPGTSKALLTLADGTQVALDTTAEGTSFRQGRGQLIKKEGILNYTETVSTAPVVFNTLAVPRGGQFRLVLADGSSVWLNAASSLRYPTAFPNGEREVELTGEGFFEVAPDASKPFRVTVNGTRIEVLGTQFNVMAYPDEGGLRTTLVEGKVRLSSGGGEAILRPGQQAVVGRQGAIAMVDRVDIEAATAWRKGLFLFRDASIEEVGRQLARWYDLEVVYQGRIAHHFNAPIPRNLPLTKALALLEGPNRVQFKLEGKKLTIYP